jgi:hypothetical protein
MELVVFIMKGSLSMKLNTISCVMVMRLTWIERRKVMEEALLRRPPVPPVFLVHFVVGTASHQLVILASILLLEGSPVH